MRGAGLPLMGRNPYQEWQASQLGPAYAGWMGSQFMPGAQPAQFNPMAFGGEGGQSMAARVAASVGNLGAMRVQPQDVQNQWVEDIGGNSALRNILAMALGGQGGRGFASPIVGRMASRMPAMQTGWEAETQAGATGPSFLEYLMSKYGLK